MKSTDCHPHFAIFQFCAGQVWSGIPAWRNRTEMSWTVQICYVYTNEPFTKNIGAFNTLSSTASSVVIKRTHLKEMGYITKHSELFNATFVRAVVCVQQGRRSHGGSGGRCPRCPYSVGARGGNRLPFFLTIKCIVMNKLLLLWPD